MIVHCLFAKSRDQVSLLVAWDEFDRESNPQGFVDACEDARRCWDGAAERAEFVYIDIQVPSVAIMERFCTPVVPAVLMPKIGPLSPDGIEGLDDNNPLHGRF